MASNQISPQGQQKEVKYKNFAEKTTSEQMHIVRGYAIISKGDTPKEIAKETYKSILCLLIHQTIGKTPAEASNINIGLSNGNRWLKLLELSLKGGRNE